MGIQVTSILVIVRGSVYFLLYFILNFEFAILTVFVKIINIYFKKLALQTPSHNNEIIIRLSQILAALE